MALSRGEIVLKSKKSLGAAGNLFNLEISSAKAPRESPILSS